MDSNQDLREFACLLCRQRKVRCDRQDPCSNCLKAQMQCSFVAPVRGKREKKPKKKPKAVYEGLHAKLHRYERMLEKHGEKLDPPLEQDASDSDATPEPVIQTPGSSMSLGTRPQTETSNLVQSTGYSANQSSSYFDR